MEVSVPVEHGTDDQFLVIFQTSDFCETYQLRACNGRDEVMSDAEAQAARHRAAEVANRIRTDESFARTVMDDPVATLRAAGVSDASIADYLREEEFDDVGGFMIGGTATGGVSGSDSTGWDWCAVTCFCSNCCNSSSRVRGTVKW
jgi:hypothetical protein